MMVGGPFHVSCNVISTLGAENFAERLWTIISKKIWCSNLRIYPLIKGYTRHCRRYNSISRYRFCQLQVPFNSIHDMMVAFAFSGSALKIYIATNSKGLVAGRVVNGACAQVQSRFCHNCGSCSRFCTIASHIITEIIFKHGDIHTTVPKMTEKVRMVWPAEEALL